MGVILRFLGLGLFGFFFYILPMIGSLKIRNKKTASHFHVIQWNSIAVALVKICPLATGGMLAICLTEYLCQGKSLFSDKKLIGKHVTVCLCVYKNMCLFVSYHV